jgi:hypothetical protein
MITTMLFVVLLAGVFYWAYSHTLTEEEAQEELDAYVIEQLRDDGA